MRKGTKRKTTHKREPKSKPAEDQINEPSQSPPAEETNLEEPSRNAEPEPVKEAAGKGRRKRARVAKPEEEPEYFPEKRNLEDLWLQVFPVGTEWDQLDTVYEYKWNFSNLEEALEEGGELHNRRVYLFGCTEPQLVPYKDQSKVTMIPVVVVVSPKLEDELEQSTVVNILFPIDPQPVFCEFDWELDELEEFTDQLIEGEALPADQKEPFKNYVKEKVSEAKKANREARQARKKAQEELDQQSKAAFKNMKFYKFYPVPTPDTPDVSGVKSPFINRYYGKAHKVI